MSPEKPRAAHAALVDELHGIDDTEGDDDERMSVAYRELAVKVLAALAEEERAVGDAIMERNRVVRELCGQRDELEAKLAAQAEELARWKEKMRRAVELGGQQLEEIRRVTEERDALRAQVNYLQGVLSI